MPPKQKDEVDINLLPPMKHMTVGLRFDCGRERATKLLNLLKDRRSFQRNLTRDEVIQFCKEKNLYVDPNSLTDKQKKDSKFMAEVSTELTPEIMNKGFNMFVEDQVLQIRKAKYLAEQQALAEKNAPPKKDDKKDAKKGGKQVEAPPPVQEIPKAPEKEYTKNFDLVFITQGYPEHPSEMIDLIVVVKEKVINWGGVDMGLLEQEEEDYQEDLEKRMEEFQQEPPVKRQYSEESVAFSYGERQIIQTIKRSRAESARDHPLRGLTIKELLLEMDLEAEEETLKQFHEQLIEEICQFSIDKVQFAEWIQNKKTDPLITKDVPQDPFEMEIAKIKEEGRLAEEQQRLQEEQLLQEKNKKGAKKEPKKSEAELEAEKQAELEKQRQAELRKQKIEQALEQQHKMRDKLHLQYFKKQIGNLDLNKLSPTILLEVLLDQINSEQVYLSQSKIPPCLEDIEDAEQVNKILNNIKEEKQFEELKQILLDECDYISVRAYGAILNDQQSIVEREHQIFDNLQFPGIDRYMMPEIAEKSDKFRKAIKSKLHPFINVDVFEFERRQLILQFEETLKENEPEHEWYFGDRIYMERHNRNTLRQQLFQALLHDPQTITKYLPDDDALMIACYFKNPPGRTLRKRWSAEWRVLPNLEHWINIRNFNSEFYYDIDYQEIGNLYERSKILYPSDNSIIVATKYYFGEEEYIRYRVIKESVIFGIRGAFFAEVPEMRISVQFDEDKAILNLTLRQGLCIRFTPAGDVIQQYLHQKQQNQTQTLLNLYDNAEINYQLETKRIITGMGSVVVYKKDGSIIVLYANGNISVYKNDGWTTTNNKGIKKSAKGIERIPCAIKTDPETGAQVYIRDDQTMVIKYKDGSQYTQHFDGTIMLTNPTQDQVIVEHPNFASVKIILDKVKQRTDTVIGMGSAYANVGFDNIFERSNDGRVVETYVEGHKIVSYLEKQELPEYKAYKTNRINLLYMVDGGIVKVIDDGEIVLVTAEERVRLNQKADNKPLGQDIEYWLQLFSVPDERKCGVYTIDLKRKCIFTKDEESNYFQIDEDGSIVSKISVSLNQEPQSPDQIPDGLFVDEENKFLPPPKQWIPPRLFLINNDNTGIELFNQEQLQHYFRIKEENPQCTKIIEEQPNCKSLSFITELQQKQVKFINIQIPQTLDIVPKTIKKTKKVSNRIFTYRNFLQYKEFDKDDRANHEQCLQKYDLWQKSVAKTQSEFGIIQKSEEEKDAEFIIQMRILESRKTDYSQQSYDQAKSEIKIPEMPVEQEVLEQTVQKTARIQQAQQAFVDVQRKVQAYAIQKSVKIKEVEVKGFVTHYFETKEGHEFSKTVPAEVFEVRFQPRQKIISQREEEVEQEANNQLAQVSVRENQQQQQQQLGLIQQQQQMQSQMHEQLPPAQYNSSRPIIIKPSIFTQAEIDDEIRLKKQLDDQYKYRQMKRKEVDVYGKDRKELKQVPCLLKTNPKSELNQKYILTDASTDNRIKISSMATRVYQQAPGINQMRSEGMHQTIIRTLDKKNNLEDMMDKKNLMVTGDLNDKLRKDLLIYPVSVRFGDLRQFGQFEVKVNVKNEDILAQRIVLKQPENRLIKVFLKQMGSISLGLVREVFIHFHAQELGQFNDEFQIISKHSIYTIPISGQVLEQQIYDKMNSEQIKLSSKPLLRKTVRDLLQIKKESIIGDSQDSELLPKINYDKNFKIDPYQQQKNQEQSLEDDQ